MKEQEKRRIYEKLAGSNRQPMTLEGTCKAPTERGLYAIACEGVVPYLYLGQATGTGDKWGVRGRLRMHRNSSDGSGDNLANYLRDDRCLAGHHGDARLLETQDGRQAFFASKCQYQAVALPQLTDSELNEAEIYAIGRSRPRLNRDDNPAPDYRLKSRTRSLWDNEYVLALALIIGFAVAAALVRRLIKQEGTPNLRNSAWS